MGSNQYVYMDVSPTHTWLLIGKIDLTPFELNIMIIVTNKYSIPKYIFVDKLWKLSK